VRIVWRRSGVVESTVIRQKSVDTYPNFVIRSRYVFFKESCTPQERVSPLIFRYLFIAMRRNEILDATRSGENGEYELGSVRGGGAEF
jgi:hypothetical protein